MTLLKNKQNAQIILGMRILGKVSRLSQNIWALTSLSSPASSKTKEGKHTKLASYITVKELRSYNKKLLLCPPQK